MDQSEDDQNQSAVIAGLNDAFRQAAIGAAFGEVPVAQVQKQGRFVVTQGFSAQPRATQIAVLEKVRLFDHFSDANDPHGEHDFGAIEQDGEQYFWKIDCYDNNLQYGSENPADPEQTIRVMTVMQACEY